MITKSRSILWAAAALLTIFVAAPANATVIHPLQAVNPVYNQLAGETSRAIEWSDEESLTLLRGEWNELFGETAANQVTKIDQAFQVIDQDAQPDRNRLHLRNHTGYTSYIFADGVLVGWVGAYGVYTFHGLYDDYYNFYARTYYGGSYWGPSTIWLPGVWNLYP